MDQPATDNRNLLNTMATFNFDAPINVTVIVEENDEFIDPFKQNKITKFHNEVERLVQTTESFCSSNFHTLHNTLISTKHKKHNKPEQHVSFSNYAKNNNLQGCKSTINNGCLRMEEVFDDEIEVQNYVNINNCFEKKSTTDILTTRELEKNAYLLDNVSQNLIEISKRYHAIFLSYLEKQHSTKREKIAHFLQYKHYFFNMSYFTVHSLILPQEKNARFIDNFINRTIALAKHTSWNIPRDYLQTLIKDIISWTKQKKRLIEIENNNRIKNLYVSIPNESPTRNSNNNKVDKNHSQNEENNNICIFSYGPENRQLTISIQPKILQTNKTDKNITIEHEQNLQSPVAKTRRSVSTHNTEVFKPVTQLPNNNKPLAHQTQFSFTSLPCYNQESIDLENYNMFEENQLALSRSSVSRDSGIFSPASTTRTGEPLDINRRNYNTTHLSTDTNAFNPNQYTEYRPCKVCCIQTNIICLGCYQEHYCSLECQENDWTNHKLNCGKQLL